MSIDSIPKSGDVTPTDSNDVLVPPEVMEVALNSLGKFFEPLCGISAAVLARDHLDTGKSLKRARTLAEYTSLDSKKLLEIGSGFGNNLAVWIKRHNVDGYGVEPGSAGFSASFLASRELLKANNIDPERIIDACGENLPFEDASFDIVYSANVLEHTEDPVRVLTEAVRVLKPGGILHFEIPNYLSYFEGHYAVIQPPIICKPLLPAWVRFVFRRDPEFAKTLKTQINPLWCRRVVRHISRSYPVKLLSLGEEAFLNRLSQPFHFETRQVEGKLRVLLIAMQWLNVRNWIGHLIVLMNGHYPILLTLRRE